MTRSRIRTLAIVLSLATISAILGGCGLSRNNPQLSQQPPASQQPSSQQPPAQTPVVQTPAPTTQPATGQSSSTDQTKQAVLDRGAKVLQLLKAKDMKALADMVHPDLGLRFSPYGYTHTSDDGDRVFKVAEISGLFADKTVYTWGAYDGSGEPINLTFAKFFDRFVFDHDFTVAPSVAYNEVLGNGNTIINVREAYPNGVFVDYHFAGFDPKYGGMDWRTLRLVFEKKEGVWYLVGIVHNEWTI